MLSVRVLIVDGEVVVRQMLARLLSAHPHLEVCGLAGDAASAQTLLESARPDVVLLDLEGLGTDSLQLMRQMRAAAPDRPIIVLTTRSPEGAQQALEALEHGAVEFLTKPDGAGNVLFATRHLEKRLMPTIEAIVTPPPPVEQAAAPTERARQRHPVGVVVLGGCTGGPHALTALLPRLPRVLPVPVLIAQHMPKGFTAALAERLTHASGRKVAEARTDLILEPNRVWIAPGGYHMTVSRTGTLARLSVHRGPREHGCRPSIDMLLRTAADTYGPHVLAVILSGHGTDGVAGCRHLHDAGGRILVQNRASSLTWSLPGAVAAAGLSDAALAPAELAEEITRRLQVGRAPARAAVPARRSTALPSRAAT